MIYCLLFIVTLAAIVIKLLYRSDPIVAIRGSLCTLHGAANTGSLIGKPLTIMTYTFRTSDLPKLDLDTDRGTDFQAWHQQWLAYRSLSGLGSESAAKQVQALHLCLSRETLNIVDNLGLTNAQKKDQAQIIAALKLYVDGRINETIERRYFRQRAQRAGESFDDFLVSLRELAKTCNF